jgi:hypothetical protein
MVEVTSGGVWWWISVDGDDGALLSRLEFRSGCYYVLYCRLQV